MPVWEHFLEIVHSSLFYQLAGVLLLAGLLGFLALRLRQPLIVAFIAAGLLSGPDFLGIVSHDSGESIGTLADLGIALLLFTVGLKLDTGLIRTLGPAAVVAGLAQVIATAGAGILMAAGMGFDLPATVCVGVAVSFSSTIIVVKLLSDQRAIESLYGKIALGILIIQDFAVILSMVALAGVASGAAQEGGGFPSFLVIPLKVVPLIGLTALFIGFLADPMTRALIRSPELMVIVSLAMAAVFAGLCHYIGLSKELGGLLAGVALASTPVREILVARLVPLRDFLLLFFFVGLAGHFDLGAAGRQIAPALLLSAFVLIGKPLIVMTITCAMGYRKRTGFMAGVSLAQISEFSLLFLAMAMEAGFVSDDAAGMMTLTGLLTFTLSTYAILYSGPLYRLCEPWLGLFERKAAQRFEEMLQTAKAGRECDIIVLGLGRYGLAIAQRLKAKGYRILGVDFDPQAVLDAQRHGIQAIYGDASNPDLPHFLPLEKAHTVLCAFPHHVPGPLSHDVRLSAVKALRLHGFTGHIAVTSHQRGLEGGPGELGADILLSPFEDAALRGADLIDAYRARN